MKMKINLFLLLSAMLLAACQQKGNIDELAKPDHKDAKDLARPNIVVILADDMGYSDLGSFGSEIKTPNIDALANNGVRFTQFYTHTTCSPTRSILLSGVDNHLNGLGNMHEWTAPNQMNVAGYEGELSEQVSTLPRILKDAGYNTYMVGKWHMGKEPQLIPRSRGFERDFSLLDGGGSYWDATNLTANVPKSLYTEDGKYLTDLPKDYYATRTYTDKLIDFIENDRKGGKPFFAYVAHQAPHDPFHLPEDWRNRHVGEYKIGWDVMRAQRLERQIELGITSKGTALASRLKHVPAAEQLDQQASAIIGRKMELYAGMVENLDFHVGRLIDYLKEIGEYENTLFIFFGDNGAEGNDLIASITKNKKSPNYKFFQQHWSKNSPEELGGPGTFVSYGPGWAQVSMTPFALFKGTMAEGGIRNSLIVSGAGVNRANGSINHSIMHVSDILPTAIEIANTKYPTPKDKPALPLQGKSWLPLLKGETDVLRSENEYLAWEIFGNRALRQGDWKIRWQWIPLGTENWELYNLRNDPSELNDLASDNPKKLNELIVLWNKYVNTNNVIIPERTPFTLTRKGLPPIPEGVLWPPLAFQKQFVPPENMIK